MFWAFRKFVPGMQFSGSRAPPPQSPPLPPSPAPISAPNIDHGPPPPIPPHPAHLQQQFNTPIVQLDTVHHAHGPPPPLPPPPPPSMLNECLPSRCCRDHHLAPSTSRTPASKLPECPHLASHAFNASGWNIHPKWYRNFQCGNYGTAQPPPPAHFPGQPLFPGPAHSNFCPCAVNLNQD
ncbi:hypothetical protein GGX14DRAFT_580885 [Mycena pura]|uniref:Uncharacterized protein n=1 Tax=Mycena pura TaxID=153505 RepID=A0AAD6XVF3_9AGAR|nr:hypothetical protein GGX14DRAFT_580885 [Mycena pura]